MFSYVFIILFYLFFSSQGLKAIKIAAMAIGLDRPGTQRCRAEELH